MKKTLMMLSVLAMAFGAFAEDSYLFWMVGDTSKPDSTTEKWDYSYAKVAYIDSSDNKGYLNLYYGDGAEMSGGATYSVVQAYQDTGMGFYAKFAENVTYSSFIVELFNDSNAFVAQSQALTYSDAASYVAMNGIGAPANMVWAATSYNVPEPNSALMLLLGSAILALRRRKQA